MAELDRPSRASDDEWMSRCLDLARRGAGHVSPNPMVGAVLVSADGRVLGEGWHGSYGGPHAEAWAVQDALRRHPAEALRDATLYVNLEPCSHHGKTPPCADLVLEHGIPRVMAGMQDPNPEVAGRGLARLRGGGVEVRVGVLERQCARLNESFVHHMRTGRPLVTLKVAQTLDGQVATATGDSRWISDKDARRLVHQWRGEIDAVMVGRGTAEADDPALTVRHVEARQPVRIVLDASGTLRPGLRLFTDDFAHRTLVVVSHGVRPVYSDQLERAGGKILEIDSAADGRVDLHQLLRGIGAADAFDNRPIQSLLVEAGRTLATTLMRADLVDRFFAFIAPKIVGAGVPTLGDLGIAKMSAARTFAEHTWTPIGPDMLFQGYFREIETTNH